MSRFSFNFYLDIRKPLKSGLYSIKVNLYDSDEKKTINFTIKKVNGIEISASKKDWEDIWLNKDKKNNFGEVVGETTVYGQKLTIRTILKAKDDILNDIMAFEGNQSLSAIKDAFYNYKLPTSYTDDIYIEFERKIEEEEAKEKYKTRDVYRNTLHNICKHNNHWDYNQKARNRKFTLRFSDVTKFWLEQYELSRSKMGIATSSISIDMRNIRAIYNRVIEKDANLSKNYPFGKKTERKYTVKKGRGRNQGLRKDDLKKIYNYSSENSYRQKARDVFLFSYYGGGMNYKDIILLTKKDVQQGYFKRKKTEETLIEEIHIPLNLTEEQKEIAARYKGKGKYLFEFLPDDATALHIYEEQKNGIGRLDKQIKAMAKELGLEVKLSYQWARHSFATNLDLNPNVSMKSIQEAMGHADEKTTRNYIDSLYKEQSSDIADALDLSDDSEDD